MTQTTSDSTRGFADHGAIVAPWAGVLVGLAAIAVFDRGVGTRPAVAILVLALGVAAGLAPLRYGLPLAVVLAGFGGLYIDFVRWHAGYWSELFVAGIVVRGVLVRRPARWELVAGGVIAAVFLGYLATGTSARAVFWGAKVLLVSALAGWGIWRLRPGRREWHATFYGLATMVAASLVLAGWQRHEGVAGLRRLGVPLRHGPRLTADGHERAFAGFTSSSPFAYALALALLTWIAFALSRRDRRTAALFVWLPPVCILGIVWTQNWLTPLATGAALIAVGISEGFRRRPVLLAAAAATLLAAVGAFAVGAGVRHALHTKSAFRTSLWHAYVREFTFGGAGPATAGSAYPHSGLPAWIPPVRYAAGWTQTFPAGGSVYRRMNTRAVVIVRAVDAPVRPVLVLFGRAESVRRPRRLTVTLGQKVAVRTGIPATAYRGLAIRIPRGGGSARLVFHARPPAEATTAAGPPFASITFENLRIRGLPAPRSPTLRVYQRVWLAQAVPEASLGGISPGVVDNQYVSWLFEYGVVGAALGMAWLLVLLCPLVRRPESLSLALAAAFTGVFVAAAAIGVNVWEESPTDLLAALVLGQAAAGLSFKGRATRRQPVGGGNSSSAGLVP
jgi:hypothetical protein